MKDIEYEVEEYSFQSFSTPTEEGLVTDFEFQDLQGKTIEQIERQQKTIKIEREVSRKSGFDISPIVRQHRGIQLQEEEEVERRIEEEVKKRVAKIQEDAFKQGHEEGVEQGRHDIYEQTRQITDEKLVSLSEMISHTLSTQSEILKDQKMELYKLIKNVTKWVVLRELKDDGKYIERLLEKLIVETQTKANLLIQVNQKSFESMPEVLEAVQARVGTLTNVRVESDYDIEDTGIILQSENGIINATLKEQFNSIDKLFDSVGVETTEDDKVDFNDNE